MKKNPLGEHRTPGSNETRALWIAGALLVLNLLSSAVHAQTRAPDVTAAAKLAAVASKG